MRLNTSALLKAVGVGLVIEVVWFAIVQGVNALLSVQNMTPEQILSSGVMVYSLALGCIGYLLYGLMGVIYGWFARRDQGTLDAGPAALGGGITTVIVAVIATAGSTLFGLVTGSFNSAIEQATRQTPGVDSSTVMIGVVVGIVGGLCLAMILGGLLGAGGGAAYAAIAGRGQAQTGSPGGPQ